MSENVDMRWESIGESIVGDPAFQKDPPEKKPLPEEIRCRVCGRVFLTVLSICPYCKSAK